MSSDAKREERFGRAEAVLGEWLAQRDAGGGDTFNILVAKHPDLAPELRELANELDHVDEALADGRRLVADNRTAIADMLAGLGDGRDFGERYTIEDEIGKGGMGAVFRVLDRRLGRLLAMKVILGQAEAIRTGKAPEVSPHELRRFLNEARINGELKHPGIVPVHDLGLDAHGRAFFTMQLVNGRTLRDVLRLQAQGGQDWSRERVLQVIQRVCEAMAYAHERGVVHRDLKPMNIMVGEFGEAYVMDWGVARRVGDAVELLGKAAAAAADQALAEKLQLTRHGDVLGTPAYMPPEQAAGHLDAIDERSDVYAVGAMLYETLAGHPPYFAPGCEWNKEELLRRIVATPPARLDRRCGPVELIAICERAMARNSLQRYPNVGELAADLGAFLERRVVKAYSTGPWAELRKWMQRNKALAMSAVAAVLFLMFGVGATSWLARKNALLAEEKSAKVQEFDQLAGVVLYDRAIAREDHLYPAWPHQVDAMEAWLQQDAGRLLAMKSTLERTVRSLRAVALPPTEGEHSFRFALESQSFLHGTIVSLLDRLASLEAKEKVAVEMRLAWAKEIHSLSSEHPKARYTWDQVRTEFATNQNYESSREQLRDFTITGVVPIGVNPKTRLLEFYDLCSACDIGQDVRQVDIPMHREDGTLAITENMGIVWVLVPRGEASLGAQASDPSQPNFDAMAKAEDAQEEAPRKRVLGPFLFAKFEATRGQLTRMAKHASMESPNYFFPSDKKMVIDGTYPAESVSWAEVSAMTRRCGMRLPSVEEWEYACRAGRDTPWSCGELKNLQDVANLADKSRGGNAQILQPALWDDKFPWIAPVGKFSPNAWGLYDMHGNVQEWCAVATNDPAEAPYKGGSFATGPEGARAAILGTDAVDFVHASLGVRPCRSVK